jgi:acetyl/propionyl-CoA carboxylase alpha subunit
VSRLSLTWAGRVVEADLDLRSPRAILKREGESFEALVRRSGDWVVIEHEGRSVRCAAVATPRGVWVASDGRTYFLERRHREAAALEGPRSSDEIRAPMTGRVAAVAARPGARAREGDLLLTIEAMKMEFKLTAPEDGVVTDVLCAEGDRVDLGQLLVTLDPKPSP